MRTVAWMRLVAPALALFFVVGGIVNIAALGGSAQDYARWGYPTWFHYVTGAIELIAASLLARERTRRSGVLLGLLVMGAAITTTLVNGEVLHAGAPLTVFGLLLALGVALNRRRHGIPVGKETL